MNKLYPVQYTCKYPTSFCSAEEISEKLEGTLSPERILSLADAGYCPHYRIDDGEPVFKITEVKAWIGANLTYHEKGNDFPLNLKVFIKGQQPDAIKKAPTAIQYIKELVVIEIWKYPPGVYFLCDGDEVVYVGQSVEVLSRLAVHQRDKKFDRAYVLPVPHEELDAVEGAFIRALKPSLNGRVPVNGKVVSPIESKDLPDSIIIERYKGDK